MNLPRKRKRINSYFMINIFAAILFNDKRTKIMLNSHFKKQNHKKS